MQFSGILFGYGLPVGYKLPAGYGYGNVFLPVYRYG